MCRGLVCDGTLHVIFKTHDERLRLTVDGSQNQSGGGLCSASVLQAGKEAKLLPAGTVSGDYDDQENTNFRITPTEPNH